jgi:hypothetical protein
MNDNNERRIAVLEAALRPFASAGRVLWEKNSDWINGKVKVCEDLSAGHFLDAATAMDEQVNSISAGKRAE